MPHPQHRTADWRRGGAALRLLALVLSLAALLLAVHAIFDFGLPVVHAQDAVAGREAKAQSPADAERRRSTAFLRGRLTQARASAAAQGAPASPAEALARPVRSILRWRGVRRFR